MQYIARGLSFYYQTHIFVNRWFQCFGCFMCSCYISFETIPKKLHFSQNVWNLQNVRNKMAQLNFKWLFCGRLANEIRFMTNRLIAFTCHIIDMVSYGEHRCRIKWKTARLFRTQDTVSNLEQRIFQQSTYCGPTAICHRSAGGAIIKNSWCGRILFPEFLRISKAQFPISIHTTIAFRTIFFFLCGND